MVDYSDPGTLYDAVGVLYTGEEIPDAFLVIGGRRLDYVNGSLRIKDAVDKRTTARLTLESDVDLDLQEGEPVALKLRQKPAFDGVLMRPTEQWPGPGNRIYKIDGVDWHYLADRRVIVASYQNTSAGAIVTAIVNDFLDADDVTPGNIATGPPVTEAVFAYIPASDALDRIAELAGFHWRIDGLKNLHFGPKNLDTAPFTLDEVDEFATSASKTKGNKDYRNRQYIRGGKAETEPRTEEWIGDGTQKTFVTGFPIAREPTITVDGNPQTIDVKGIGDPDADWFWARGSAEITQNANNAPVANGLIIEITYKGLFDLVVISTNQQEVDRRLGVESFGTGFVDAVETAPNVTNADSAFEVAAGKLEKFGTEGVSFQWDTEKEGLHAGQLITVNLPDRGLDSVDLLIVSVDTKDTASRLIHTVRAVDGPDDGDWAGWFKRSMESLDPISFRENLGEEEILIILASFTENWSWSEDITTTVFACVVVGIGTSTETYNEATITYSDASTAYVGDATIERLPTSTETYNEATLTYADPNTAYYGSGADILDVVC